MTIHAETISAEIYFWSEINIERSQQPRPSEECRRGYQQRLPEASAECPRSF